MVKSQSAMGACCDSTVVSHSDHGETFSIQFFDERQNFVAHALVEVACRLVCQQYAGSADDGSRDRDTLLLSARQFAWPVAAPIAKTHARECLRHTVIPICAAEAPVLECSVDVLASGEGGDQIEGLKYEADLISSKPSVLSI